MPDKKYILFLLCVFATLIIFRLSCHHEVFLWEDHDMALNLLNHGELYYDNDGAKNHTFQFPIYPAVLTGIYFLFGVNTLVVCLFNIFLHVITALVLFALFNLLLAYISPSLEEKKKDKIVFVSVCLFLFHPALLFYSLYHVHPITLNALTLFLSFYFSLKAGFSPSTKNLILTGLLVGLAMLDRATAALTLIPAGILLLKNFGFVSTFKKCLVIVASVCITICPWLIRNYVTDGIIGFESAAAKDRWKGVLYNSDGSNYLLNGNNYYAALSEKEITELSNLSVSGQSDFFNAKYNTILKNDLSHVIKLFFVKLKNFWWFRPGAGQEWGSLKTWLPAYKIIYGIILVLVFYLLTIRFKKMLLVLSFPFALSMLQAYFYVEMRHRIIVEPLLIFLAVVATVFLYEKIRAKKLRL